MPNPLNIRRALLSVTDKTGLVDLGRALAEKGVELFASGGTLAELERAGIRARKVEEISGSPEAFQGRMKTLSFPIFSGILYRRGDAADEQEMQKLKLLGIDVVVVNFYSFEQKPGIETIDIGGPALVRAAAKNSPQTLVLTDPKQYPRVIEALQGPGVSTELAQECSARAWDRVLEYDRAIAQAFGESARSFKLRYGENPHQRSTLRVAADSPVDWANPLCGNELSYNNLLDVSSGYELMSDLVGLFPQHSTVVILKHNNPCGVACVEGKSTSSQLTALTRAWEGDPVSAFGGILLFSDEPTPGVLEWLSGKFVELIAAPGLSREHAGLSALAGKRKNLKAVRVHRWGDRPKTLNVVIPGGVLEQTPDTTMREELVVKTKKPWPSSHESLAQFGIKVCKVLKSNAIAIVRSLPGEQGYQLVGAGQGQPNRVEALLKLALPRARGVLEPEQASLGDCVMVSDAFFPFRDTVDGAAGGGIRWIVQPGGSVKDAEVITAADEHGVGMVFTGVRHFRH